MASLVAQMVKNLSAMYETRVLSLGWEEPLEKGMATHSSILAWKIPWTERPGRLQSMDSQRARDNWTTNTFTFMITLNAHYTIDMYHYLKNSSLPFKLSKPHSLLHTAVFHGILSCSREQLLSIPHYPSCLSNMIPQGGRHLAQKSRIYSSTKSK